MPAHCGQLVQHCMLSLALTWPGLECNAVAAVPHLFDRRDRQHPAEAGLPIVKGYQSCATCAVLC